MSDAHVASAGEPVEERLRQLVREHVGIELPPDASADADLWDAGMTSRASVNLMLAVEDAFDVEFPDHLLTRATFTSIDTISAALTELQAGGAQA